MWSDGGPLNRLQVWDARDAADRDAWIMAWERIADADPFSHPDYIAAFAADGEMPMCAGLDGPDDEGMLHAFLRRPIREDACGNPVEPGLWDAYTVLLYGGPLARRSSEALQASFRRRFQAWAQSTGLVSEFVRMSPVAGRRLPYPGTVREQAPHIVCDLRTDSPDDLWAGMRSNVRRGAARARAAGLTVAIDETGERLEDFLRIYDETMDRVGSAERFRFPASTFTRMHEALPGGFAYVYVEHEGRAVAVELVLASAETGYFFLGGTETAALPMYASVLVHCEAIAYAWSRGLKDYVLTGGVTNTTDDSLLRFKRGFAPRGDSLYLTGEQVFHEDAYARLLCCTADIASYGTGRTSSNSTPRSAQTSFFPAYRAPQGARVCEASPPGADSSAGTSSLGTPSPVTSTPGTSSPVTSTPGTSSPGTSSRVTVGVS